MDTKETDLQEETPLQEEGVTEESEVLSVYEVGYHILPTVSEGDLEAETALILKDLKDIHAEIFGQRAPASVKLSYGIEKKIGEKKEVFENAYFGWIAFEATPSSIANFEIALKEHATILRYIVVKTSRDAVAATLADPRLDAIPFVEDTTPDEEAVEKEVEEEGEGEEQKVDTDGTENKE